MNLAAAILSGVQARIARNIVQISGCTNGVIAAEVPDHLPVMGGGESTESCAVLLHSLWTRVLRTVSSAEPAIRSMPREEESS
jgi:hypothetical protein